MVEGEDELKVLESKVEIECIAEEEKKKPQGVSCSVCLDKGPRCRVCGFGIEKATPPTNPTPPTVIYDKVTNDPSLCWVCLGIPGSRCNRCGNGITKPTTRVFPPTILQGTPHATPAHPALLPDPRVIAKQQEELAREQGII